jgi:hypothetical protein
MSGWLFRRHRCHFTYAQQTSLTFLVSHAPRFALLESRAAFVARASIYLENILQISTRRPDICIAAQVIYSIIVRRLLAL